MKKLLSIISLAIAAVASLRKANTALQSRVAELESEAASHAGEETGDQPKKRGRKKQHDADAEPPEHSFEEAQQKQFEADQKAAELKSHSENADASTMALAEVLNNEPVVESVHPETFEVTEKATAPLSDLEFRQQQAEQNGGEAP